MSSQSFQMQRRAVALAARHVDDAQPADAAALLEPYQLQNMRPRWRYWT